MPLTPPSEMQPGAWAGEDCLLKRAVLVSLALLAAGHAAAGEMERPIITLSEVNWDTAAASLTDRGSGTPAEAFDRLNAITGKRFTGIGKSSVPVLLPFDVDAFRKDAADGKPEAASSDKYFGQFQPTKFFLPGPAGYDATFVATGYPKPASTSRSWPRYRVLLSSTRSTVRATSKKKRRHRRS